MSKPNLETIISDLQPKLQALEPLEIASEYAKILAERNELKAENVCKASLKSKFNI